MSLSLCVSSFIQNHTVYFYGCVRQWVYLNLISSNGKKSTVNIVTICKLATFVCSAHFGRNKYKSPMKIWTAGHCPGPRASHSGGHFVFGRLRNGHCLMRSHANRAGTGFTGGKLHAIKSKWPENIMPPITDPKLFWKYGFINIPELFGIQYVFF